MPNKAGRPRIPWTLFWDMHSGGSQKERQALIFIQAPYNEAEIIFYNRFGHNPNRVTCTCCGPDYSISESPTLDEASLFHRTVKHYPSDKATVQTIKKFLQTGNVLIIKDKDILDSQRKGELPEQGYVWKS